MQQFCITVLLPSFSHLYITMFISALCPSQGIPSITPLNTDPLPQLWILETCYLNRLFPAPRERQALYKDRKNQNWPCETSHKEQNRLFVRDSALCVFCSVLKCVLQTRGSKRGWFPPMVLLFLSHDYERKCTKTGNLGGNVMELIFLIQYVLPGPSFYLLSLCVLPFLKVLKEDDFQLWLNAACVSCLT